MTEASDALRSRDDALRIRPAVRALMITPDAEILLVRFEFPTRTVWAMPGGGVDPGEDDLTALRRELVEETGVHDVEIGPHIWTREHVIPFVDGSWDGQRDHVFHVPIERFEPQPAIGWDAMRAERVHEMRWWTLAQISAERNITFAPADLFRHLRDLIERGLPERPIDTGV